MSLDKHILCCILLIQSAICGSHKQRLVFLNIKATNTAPADNQGTPSAWQYYQQLVCASGIVDCSDIHEFPASCSRNLFWVALGHEGLVSGLDCVHGVTGTFDSCR